MKSSFADDPSLSGRLFDLLETIFPGVRKVAQNAGALGASWESVSTPFVRLEHGRLVSHVGVIELSLVLLGRVERVGAIHGVATHPEARRRGHYRGLMEEVLRHCADRFEAARRRRAGRPAARPDARPIGQPVDEVVICFSADQLGVDAEVGPHVFDHDGPSYLMVHGLFAAEDRTFTLPRSART
jgi:GNAT superfamily N-acetyltransferase